MSKYTLVQGAIAEDKFAYSSVLLTEDAMFYSAEVYDSEDRFVMSISTGSGIEVRDVLAEFLRALADGTATFDYEYATEKYIRKFRNQPDGREVSLSRTNVGYYALDVEASIDGVTCETLHPMGIYFQSEELARKVGSSISAGMLGFSSRGLSPRVADRIALVCKP